VEKGVNVMATNVIFSFWDKSVPGRETISAQHFQEYGQYMGRLQAEGKIQSFEAVLLDPHGGGVGGFILIRGEHAQLDAIMATDEWQSHQSRGAIHLQGQGIVRGVTGDELMKRMAGWASMLPK
jgi:hypothetical protein